MIAVHPSEEDIMRLYLARHGDALSKDQDPERPLSETGRKQVAHVADVLEQIGAGVDRVVHSGKPRAQQSAEILAQSVMWEPELESIADMNPGDPVEPWVERVASLDTDTMLVGHLPFLAKLASRLVTGNEDAGVVSFPAGTVVCLERSADGDWQVAAVVPPTL
jgi:phosphohistidine phosphatase